MISQKQLDDFTRRITQVTQEYANTTQEQLNDAARIASRKGATELRKQSTGEFINRSGAKTYRRGWRAKLVRRGGQQRWIIYNKDKARLTHLLEKGHANRNKALPDVKAYPHIAEIEEKVNAEFLKLIRERLS